VVCFFMHPCKKFRSSLWALQCCWWHMWMEDVISRSWQHLDSWYSYFTRSRTFYSSERCVDQMGGPIHSPCSPLVETGSIVLATLYSEDWECVELGIHRSLIGALANATEVCHVCVLSLQVNSHTLSWHASWLLHLILFPVHHDHPVISFCTK